MERRSGFSSIPEQAWFSLPWRMRAPPASVAALFSQRVDTAYGPVRVAPVMLREIRLEQLSIESVPAAVIENLDRSVLGMSFLKRLKSFEMREGALTINW